MYQISGGHHEGEVCENVQDCGRAMRRYGTMGWGHEHVWQHEGKGCENVGLCGAMKLYGTMRGKPMPYIAS